MFSDNGEIPVRITKKEVEELAEKGEFNFKHLIFQRAMLGFDNHKNYIVGAKYDGKVVSFIILDFVDDEIEKKKWCLIRYYKRSSIKNSDEYIFKRLFTEIKRVANFKKVDYIVIPNYLINKQNDIFTKINSIILNNNSSNVSEKNIEVNGEDVLICLKIK